MHARSRLPLLVSLVSVAGPLLAGCGPETRTNNFDLTGVAVLDFTVGPDLATRDLAAADMATRDMASTGDMASPGDMAVPVDMAVVVDMAVEVDMAVVVDMTTPPDQTVVDLTPPPDLVVVDLVKPPDLVPPPDLVVTPDMAVAAPLLLVTHVGDGMAALSSAATQMVVRKFKLDGNELKVDNFPLTLPLAANGNNQILTVAGSATSEGHITASGDGKYAVVVGYAAAVGTAAVAGTKSMATNRVVGRIDTKGNVDTSTRTDTAFDAANIRSAATDDGTRFWATGSSGGVQLLPFGKLDPGTQILGTPANTRVTNIFGGQLFVTSGSANYTTVMSVGMGLPTMGGQMAGIGMGLTTVGAGPYNYAFFDLDGNVAGLDNLYLTDDRVPGSGGGIQHWTFDGAKWTLAATLNGGLAVGIRGLAASVSNKVVTLYATTAEAAANSLVSIVDQGMNPMATVLATAPANTAYRAVCFAPTN